MRDHTKLRAFELADALALEVYALTRQLPDDERFGLTAQLRRGAVSIASNIVEGCARPTEADYLRFLGMAYAAARELESQLSLARRLRYVDPDDGARLQGIAIETCKVLNGLIRSLR